MRSYYEDKRKIVTSENLPRNRMNLMDFKELVNYYNKASYLAILRPALKAVCMYMNNFDQMWHYIQKVYGSTLLRSLLPKPQR